jgi:hypothetical protein
MNVQASTAGVMVCVNPLCRVAGYAITRSICRGCGQRNHRRDEPGLIIPSPRPPAGPVNRGAFRTRRRARAHIW